MSRILICISLAALLAAGWLCTATAEEPKAALSDAAVARLAHRLLQEVGPVLENALTRTEGLDLDTLRRLVLEMRSQIRIQTNLAQKRVKGLRWKDVDLDQIVTYLRTVTGERFTITPRVRSEQFAGIRVTLSLDDVSVGAVLGLVTMPHDLRWVPQNGVVHIITPEELVDDLLPKADASGDAADAAFRAKIAATMVSLNVNDETFGDVVKILSLQTGFNFQIDPRITSDVEGVEITGLLVEDIALDTCLNLLQGAAGEDVVWTTKGRVIVFTHRKFLNR